MDKQISKMTNMKSLNRHQRSQLHHHQECQQCHHEFKLFREASQEMFFNGYYPKISKKMETSDLEDPPAPGEKYSFLMSGPQDVTYIQKL